VPGHYDRVKHSVTDKFANVSNEQLRQAVLDQMQALGMMLKEDS
jgi:hypothetical protein